MGCSSTSAQPSICGGAAALSKGTANQLTRNPGLCTANRLSVYNLTRCNLSALLTTLTDERVIAAAMAGDSVMPSAL